MKNAIFMRYREEENDYEKDNFSYAGDDSGINTRCLRWCIYS